MSAEPAKTLPPLKAVSATDQGGVLAIAASLGLVVALVSLLIRAYVRRENRVNFAKDDISAVLSMAVTIIQSAIVFVAIGRGFGKIGSSLTTQQQTDWQRDMYISDFFYLMGLWLTKCSIAFLWLRLSRDPIHARASRILLVVLTLIFAISVLVVFIRCDLAQPWVVPGSGSCPKSTFDRWIAVATLDIASEVALFIGGLWLVRDLQLSWSKKGIVLIAYGTRLLVVIATGVRLHYLHAMLSSDDPSLHGVMAAVMTQVELCYAVVAATMPCLRPFMNALNTHYGGGPAQIYATYGAGASSGNKNSDGTQGTQDTEQVNRASRASRVSRPTPSKMMSGAAHQLTDLSASRRSSESAARILESQDPRSSWPPTIPESRGTTPIDRTANSSRNTHVRESLQSGEAV